MGVAARLAGWNRWAPRNLAGPLGTLSDITFPTSARLRIQVRIALGADLSADPATWAWEEITRYVRYEPAISITQWKQDESSTTTPSSARLVLDNRDGRFSRRNPSGAYFGLLSKNTPIWISVDPGDGMHSRFEGFVNAWPTRWNMKVTDSVVMIECAGIMRRLNQGRVIRSAMHRYLTQLTTTTPVAAWTLEEGRLVSVGAPLYGVWSMQPFTGTHPSGAAVTYPQWGRGVLAPWLPNVVSRSSSVGLTALYARMAMPTFTTTWTIDFLYASGTDAPNSVIDVNPSYLGGSAGWPQLTLLADIEEIWVSFDGSPETQGDATGMFDGLVHHIRWTATQNGTGVDWVVYVDAVAVNSGTETTYTLPAIRRLSLVNEAGSSDIAQGYVSVWTSAPPVADYTDAALGYAGEMAHERIQRICDEESIPYYSVAGGSVAMGPQPMETPLAIARECEAADHGTLYEKGWGLAYASRAERENQAAAFTLDFDDRDVALPPEPTDDDQRTRNRVTVSRRNGGEDTVEETSGPQGTGGGGPGIYDDSVTVNVQSDDDLLVQAGYLVTLGTVDEVRWPRLDVGLHNSPDLISTVTAMPPATRLAGQNPPDQPDPIDAVVEGYAERFDPFTWDLSFNTSPASPHHVFRLAETTGDTDPFVGYVIPTTCVLAEDLDTTETGVEITTDPLWSTDADDWTPGAAIVIGGEVMTVTAVSGGSNPQTLTVVRNVNGIVGGKSHSAGDAVEFKSPGVLGL